MLGFSPLSSTPIGADLWRNVTDDDPAIAISPNAGHAAQTIRIDVEYVGGATTSASNPFLIQSGTGSIAGGSYVQDDSTNCHFNFVQAGVSGTPTVFEDTVAGLTASYSNAAVAPLAPAIGTFTDNGDGTGNITFTADPDNGGEPVTLFNAISSNGYLGSSATSPINFPVIPGAVNTTVRVTATNSVDTSAQSAASNQVTPVRTVRTTFYVKNSGSDANNGKSLLTPWLTRGRVSAFALIADVLICAAGETLAGTGPLTLNVSDTTESEYLVVGTGRGSTYAEIAPVNQAKVTGGNGNCFNCIDGEYVWCDNLIGEGLGVSLVDGSSTSTGSAFNFKSTQATNKLRGIRLTACTATGTKNGFVFYTSTATKAGYEDLDVWNCKAYSIQRTSLLAIGWHNFDTEVGTFGGGTKTQFADVSFRYCYTYDITGAAGVPGANGPGICNATVGLIDHCVCHDINAFGGTAPEGGSAGIFAIVADAIVIQDCEASKVYAPNDIDGVGFDLDGGVTNSIVQRCYAHHNHGAGLYTGRYDANETTGNIYRYCVSAHNHTRATVLDHAEFAKFNDALGGVGCYIYHCTFVGSNTHAIKINGDAGWIYFWNNIFVVAAGKSIIDGTEPEACEGNCYWTEGGGATVMGGSSGLTPALALDDWRDAGYEVLGGDNGIAEDPLLLDPDGAPDTVTLPAENIATLTYFDIPPNSPAKDAAVDLTTLPYSLVIGDTDFHGRPNLSGAGRDIGAHEYHPPGGANQRRFSRTPFTVGFQGVH